MKLEQIIEIVERKREVHSELRSALTWAGITQICRRERIRIRKSPEPMTRRAQLIPYRGRWTIMISRDVPPRRHTYLAAHELGHLWLHHDRQHARTDRVYNMDTHWANDPREDDAETFAAIVLMGPRHLRPYTGHLVR